MRHLLLRVVRLLTAVGHRRLLRRVVCARNRHSSVNERGKSPSTSERARGGRTALLRGTAAVVLLLLLLLRTVPAEHAPILSAVALRLLVLRLPLLLLLRLSCAALVVFLMSGAANTRQRAHRRV